MEPLPYPKPKNLHSSSQNTNITNGRGDSGGDNKKQLDQEITNPFFLELKQTTLRGWPG